MLKCAFELNKYCHPYSTANRSKVYREKQTLEQSSGRKKKNAEYQREKRKRLKDAANQASPQDNSPT
jgi:hypothetical protein